MTTKLFAITIDHGNTNPHVGFMADGVPEKIVSLKTFEEQKLWAVPPYQDAPFLLSMVGSPHPFFETDIFKSRQIDFRCHKQEKSFLDMSFDYTSTLGDDRLFQAYYAFKHFLEGIQNHLVLIDSGTFITVDFLSRKGLLGGYIFPGERPYFRSYGVGSHLPSSLGSDQKAVPIAPGAEVLPHSTEAAIRGAATVYLQAIYREVLALHGKVDKIILTGGLAEKHLAFISNAKASAGNGPVHHDRDFIHKAMFTIYSTLHQQGLIKGKHK